MIIFVCKGCNFTHIFECFDFGVPENIKEHMKTHDPNTMNYFMQYEPQ